MENQLNEAPCGYLSLNTKGMILSVNDTFLQWIQYNREELIGQHIETFLTNANRFLFHSHIYPAIQMDEEVYEVYMSLQSKKGQPIPIIFNAKISRYEKEETIECTVIPIRKRIQYENEIREINKKLEEAYLEKQEALSRLEIALQESADKTIKLVELNEELDKVASTDSLTGLTNRRGFLEAYDHQISLYTQTERSFSLFLLDIDHFKLVNDTWGHLVGDQFLRDLAKILMNVARKQDTVCRYGGEEFVVLLPETDTEEARILAEKWRDAVETADWDIKAVTISIGIATFQTEDNQNTLLAKADAALYYSKQNGRNRVTHAKDIQVPSLGES
ncbi:diguanylate cyclase [Halobacillus fulvus]|nr:diguanylate cyclase [Halobacillus fulvus]